MMFAPDSEHFRQAWNNYCQLCADIWLSMMVPWVDKTEVKEKPKFTVVKMNETNGEMK